MSSDKYRFLYTEYNILILIKEVKRINLEQSTNVTFSMFVKRQILLKLIPGTSPVHCKLTANINKGHIVILQKCEECLD